MAAPRTPDSTLADESGALKSECQWSALECAGGYAGLPVPEGSAIVLGEPFVVIGWPQGADGRRRFAGSAVYDASDELVAQARAVWFEVPSSSWG